jgi:hypothetical protein
MSDHGHGKGHASREEGLAKAFDNAWEDAKRNGGEAGCYKAEIKVKCENPIRTYIVTLDQVDDDD